MGSCCSNPPGCCCLHVAQPRTESCKRHRYRNTHPCHYCKKLFCCTCNEARCYDTSPRTLLEIIFPDEKDMLINSVGQFTVVCAKCLRGRSHDQFLHDFAHEQFPDM